MYLKMDCLLLVRRVLRLIDPIPFNSPKLSSWRCRSSYRPLNAHGMRAGQELLYLLAYCSRDSLW